MSGRLRAAVRGLAARAFRRLGEQRRLVGPEFDAAYYLASNPDVAALGLDPLDHFLTHGWREGRDPTPQFSVADYLDGRPDVAAAGVNPFVHYLRHGRGENQPRAEDLGFRYRAIRDLQPMAAQVAAALAGETGAPVGTAEQLEAALRSAGAGRRGLHVTFSHDDYRAYVGGVQLCIQQEAARMAAAGRDHLNLHPVGRWPVLRAAGEPGRLRLVFNDRDLGVYAPDSVVAAMARAAVAGAGERSFAIHSLLGHAASEAVGILEALGLTAGFYWLHDYASLCAGFHLLRDNVEDCAAPPPGSAACSVCVYGPARDRQLAAHELLFQRLRLTVVSPAPSTLDLWRRAWPFPAPESLVHPHVRLVERGPAPVRSEGGPLRVAYAGHAATHKGWPVFREVALSHASDGRYAFLHLGDKAEPGLPIEFHPVRVTADRPRAMVEALERLEVDVLLFWPLWRETFSFTVYEAIAAGCAVVTGPDSGNVAAVVGDGRHGRVLPHEAALAEAFAKGALAGLSRASRRPMLYDLAMSGMTADLIRPRAIP